MIISKTPFRISFFGGGTDYPDWYREHGGAVISTTIDKYCYISLRYLPPFFDYKFRIRYYQKEECMSVADIIHPSVRECLRSMQIDRGVEIVHNADLPAQSGLGSSSTFTVGLLHALFKLKNQVPTKRQLAIDAIHIEQEMIAENVGSQDQTAAAFGGLNLIEFGGPQEISVRPLMVPPERRSAFEEHLMLYFTRLSRKAFEVAGDQIERIKRKQVDLRDMMAMVGEAERILMSPGANLHDIGRLLHEQWMLKRAIAPSVSNDYIDDIYRSGREAGATGGKILGAGGGGFMLFFVPLENRKRVNEALHKYLQVPCRFENVGSQILFFEHDGLIDQDE